MTAGFGAEDEISGWVGWAKEVRADWHSCQQFPMSEETLRFLVKNIGLRTAAIYPAGESTRCRTSIVLVRTCWQGRSSREIPSDRTMGRRAREISLWSDLQNWSSVQCRMLEEKGNGSVGHIKNRVKSVSSGRPLLCANGLHPVP